VAEIRRTSVHVATRVVQQAFDDGVAQTKKTTRATAADHVRARAWQPRYLPLEKVLSS
jgi:malic enzyme